MERIDWILLIFVFALFLICVSLYANLNSTKENLTTINNSLLSTNTNVSTLTSTTSANSTAVASLQAALASRSITTNLVSVTTSLTPTFSSTNNVNAASCTSIYTALSNTMSETLNVISVTPIAASFTSIQIPINTGSLTTIDNVIVLGIEGQSDTNYPVNNLTTPLIDVANKMITINFVANSSNTHTITLCLRLV